MSIRRMPYGSTIPFSSHLIATSSTQSSEDSESTGGSGGGSGGGTSQTIYELIDPYLTQDNGLILEQAGDTPPSNASEYDHGFHLFDGDDTTIWKIYDGVTQNGYGTLVYDLQIERTITHASFVNLNSSIAASANIELYVSNNPNVPMSTSTKLVDLTGQFSILRTGMVPVSTSESGRYVRLKVSHPYGYVPTFMNYGLASMRLYGTPFLANDLISPNIQISQFGDDGNTTVSGNGPAPYGGDPSHTDGWHVFDGFKTFSTAVQSPNYSDSQGWLGNTASGSWLMYDFGSAKTATLFKFWNYDNTTISGGVYPKGTDSLTISGSNDNITFTDLVTDTGKGSTANWITSIPTPAAYRYYKITVNNHTSSTETVCGFIELEIYGG